MGSPVDDALDRLRRFIDSGPWYGNSGETASWKRWSDEARGNLATVREALEQQRGRIYILENMRSENYIEELESAGVEADKYRKATDQQARRAEAAEAEVRRLDDLRALYLKEADRWSEEANRLREGLREKDEIIDCLLQRGYFDPFVPLAAFRKIVPKGAYSVTTADEERAWLAKIEARALLADSPDGPDDFCEHGYTTENAAHPSAGLERCPTCSPTDGGGAK